MKLLIKISLLFLVPSCVLAGISGGGGGPRPGMGDTMTVKMDVLTFDGGSCSGIGPRPTDFIRTLGQNQSEIIFQIAHPATKTIDTLKMRPEEFGQGNQVYLEALRKAVQSKQWEPVSWEGLGN